MADSFVTKPVTEADFQALLAHEKVLERRAALSSGVNPLAYVFWAVVAWLGIWSFVLVIS